MLHVLHVYLKHKLCVECTEWLLSMGACTSATRSPASFSFFKRSPFSPLVQLVLQLASVSCDYYESVGKLSAPWPSHCTAICTCIVSCMQQHCRPLPHTCQSAGHGSHRIEAQQCWTMLSPQIPAVSAFSYAKDTAANELNTHCQECLRQRRCRLFSCVYCSGFPLLARRTC